MAETYVFIHIYTYLYIYMSEELYDMDSSLHGDFLKSILFFNSIFLFNSMGNAGHFS